MCFDTETVSEPYLLRLEAYKAIVRMWIFKDRSGKSRNLQLKVTKRKVHSKLPEPRRRCCRMCCCRQRLPALLMTFPAANFCCENIYKHFWICVCVCVCMYKGFSDCMFKMSRNSCRVYLDGVGACASIYGLDVEQSAAWSPLARFASPEHTNPVWVTALVLVDAVRQWHRPGGQMCAHSHSGTFGLNRAQMKGR